MRVIALVKRIILQIIHDKRTLALMMVAPLVILTLMNFLFENGNDTSLKIGTYNLDSEIVKTLKENDVDVITYTDDSNIKNKITDDNLAAFISLSDNNLDITYENSDPSKSMAVNSLVKGTLSKVEIDKLTEVAKEEKEIILKQQEMLSKLPNSINKENTTETLPKDNSSKEDFKITANYIYGNENTDLFDTFTPILIGFFVFFFVFLISGISLLKERSSGTLDKLLSSPIRRSEIVFGYLIGYGLFAIIQTFVIVFYSIYVLNINILGSLPLVILTNIITAFVALSFGTLLSTFANSEFQMMQFIPVVVIPQVFFSGIIPISNMSSVLQSIAKFIPMYYVGDALQGIMIKGESFEQISFDLLILLLFAVIFIFLNIIGLKRYRKI